MATTSSRVGQRQIAEEAGVAIGTVSNTINHPELVAPHTRTKIEEVMERLGFVHDEGAASLKRGSNRLIGLVIPDITNPFYSEITRGVTSAADAAGYGVVLCNSADDPAAELAHLGKLARLRAVGALVAPLTADTERLDKLRRIGTHLVLIDRSAVVDVGCSTAMDDVSGGALAAQHVIDSGRRRIALINGSESIPQCFDRRLGVYESVNATRRADIEVRELTVPEMTTADGRLAVLSLLDDPATIPDAIICTNDQLAVGSIRALTERQLRVPEDVIVVGYGDLAIAADAPLPLTTIRQPKFQLGQSAVELLLAEIRASDSEHHHVASVYRPSLVIRASAP